MSEHRTKLQLITMALWAFTLLPLSQAKSQPDQEQVKKLIGVLKSDAQYKEKADACRQLAVVGTKEAVPALVALLGDEKLSHMARYALEPIRDEAVDNAFRDALGKLKGRPLVGVIGSIGVRRDAKAVPSLIRLLHNDDAQVVVATARTLGRLATDEAAKALREKLGKAPAATRAAVADGCLACAETLLEHGHRDKAVAIYESVAKADLPKHVQAAAKRAIERARKQIKSL